MMSCKLVSSTLKIGVVCSSETLVTIRNLIGLYLPFVVTLTDHLIPWKTLLIETQMVHQEIHEFLRILLSRSEEPVTGPCPQPEESISQPYISFKAHFNIILPTTPSVAIKTGVSTHRDHSIVYGCCLLDASVI